tara:strand:- start:2540 stop:2827 length:288 start_codon:yes stop_codon:yes gene_type:complete
MEEEENLWPKSKTIIRCTICKKKWFSVDINRDNEKAECTCGNLKLGILDMTPPTRAPEGFFVTIKYKEAYPELYEVHVDESGKIVKKGKALERNS